MGARVFATLCSGLFAGASIYVNLVEHPARIQCGPALAVAQFRPSYRRGAVMQASLAAVGCITALAAWRGGAGPWWMIGGILLGAIIPYTLIIILPTNKELLYSSLDPGSERTKQLLKRWGRLDAARSLLSVTAFVIFILLL